MTWEKYFGNWGKAGIGNGDKDWKKKEGVMVMVMGVDPKLVRESDTFW